MYDYRKYNVNSFIGHSVVLQYVTVHRVEQIWSAKARLYANLPQWRHKYANLYVTSPATTSLTQSCGKHYYTLFIYHIYFFHFKFAHQSCTHKIVYIIYCVFAILYIAYLYIIILLSVSCRCHSVALWSFSHSKKIPCMCKHTWPIKLNLILIYKVQRTCNFNTVKFIRKIAIHFPPKLCNSRSESII